MFFFSCVTFVAMLDTEHCVLFDLHVRDRIEYIKKKKKTVKKETNEGGWLDNVVNRFNGIDTPLSILSAGDLATTIEFQIHNDDEIR